MSSVSALVPCSVLKDDGVTRILSPSSNMRGFLLGLPLFSRSGTGTYMLESFCSILENAPRPSEDACKHPLMYKGTCLTCKECTAECRGLKLDYLEPGLRVSRKDVDGLREKISRNLLRARKLHLVLDLDNTLLHTISCSDLCPKEAQLKPTGDLFVDKESSKITKLRPFVRSFLEEASTMFELTAYTLGTRTYAKKMVELLDPERCYFGNRVIAKEDWIAGEIRGIKSLNVLLAKESCTLILDDDSKVWPYHSGNLLLAEPFNYFANNRRTYMYSTSDFPRKPNSEGDNYLADVLDVLKAIHRRYFDEFGRGREGPVDIKTVLSLSRQDVLKGCKILTGIPHWATEVARQLGATIVSEPSSSVTHVVSEFPNAPHARWALYQNKFIVKPEWVFAAYRLWKRPSEHDFQLNVARRYKAW